MKFAHIADVHLGGWRDEKLKEIGLKSFQKAVDVCIEKSVDFLVISGDLFNTSVPSIDVLKFGVSQLQRLKDKNINVYVIMGSHDFSASGKAMIEVLEEARLLKNVMNIKDSQLILTTDKKTGVKLGGIYGRKGGLELEDYKAIDTTNATNQDGFKVFLFHTAIDEFKPSDLENVDCQSYKELPEGFNYYAGGHVHYILKKEILGGTLTYPGATFPNNFKELEEFNHGHMFIVTEDNIEDVWLKIKDVESINIDVNNLNPLEAEEKIVKEVQKLDSKDRIVTVRIKGVIKEGRTSDINLNRIDKVLKNSYAVLKNTSKLLVKEQEQELLVDKEEKNPEEIEKEVIISKIELKDKQSIAQNILKSLAIEKEEGQKNLDFEKRIIELGVSCLDLKELLSDEN